MQKTLNFTLHSHTAGIKGYVEKVKKKQKKFKIVSSPFSLFLILRGKFIFSFVRFCLLNLKISFLHIYPFPKILIISFERQMDWFSLHLSMQNKNTHTHTYRWYYLNITAGPNQSNCYIIVANLVLFNLLCSPEKSMVLHNFATEFKENGWNIYVECRW